MLGYNVLKKNFSQSTDYSAVILELVMSGENPYDYLGVNYVKKFSIIFCQLKWVFINMWLWAVYGSIIMEHSIT